MRVYLRNRASQLLLWSALVVMVVSGSGDVRVEAQAPALRWDGLIELISGKYDYPPPTTTPQTPADGPSTMTRHAVSGDGRYVVFTAEAPSLGVWGPALYVRDRRVGETRVLLNGSVRDAAISADGRHVAFTICDQYIRPDQALICDVWAIDMQTWSWTPMSTTPYGDYGTADSGEAVLSGNGRFVVFRTAAVNLTGPSAQGVAQLVLRDRDADGNGVFDEPGTAVIEVVSAPNGGAGARTANAASDNAEVSDDGRYVAFRSAATNLVAGDTNNGWDVFRRDRAAARTSRVNLRPGPDGSNESPDSVDSPAISMTPDGRYIAFASADGMLAPGSIDDYNNVRDVFVYDAQGEWLQRLDVGWGPPVAVGYVPGNGPTEWPTLSADGRYVSVQSAASNVASPPTMPGSTHVYVVDRLTGAVSRVSVKPDGTEPDRDAVKPSISADGSLVTFVSQAFNLAFNVYTESDRIYAASHFDITPAEQFVSGGGGSATYTISAQQHTQWWVDWTEWQHWVSFESAPMGVGSGTVTFSTSEPNPASTPRSATIRVFEQSALFTQLDGLSLTSVSPSSGPGTGGTLVTLTGTGFEPGMRVAFDGVDALATEYVSSTTLRATAPPHAPGTVWVAVFGQPPDHRAAWIDGAFRYTDTTPPQLWYGLNGEAGEDGWYRSNVTLSWARWDPESPVTSTSGCDTTEIWFDTPGATFTCVATSEGGAGTLTAVVKRDATPPTATITRPQYTIYEQGAVVQPQFTCQDGLSGVTSCVGDTNGAPIDTLTSGYHTYSVAMTDLAGNAGVSSVDYAVESGACAYPLPDMVAWWRLEGNTRNTRSNVPATATRVGLTSDVYVDGMVGQAYQFEGPNGYLQTPFTFTFQGDKKFAIAAWVKPSANTLYGTIIRSREAYSVARLGNGSVAWAFRKFGVTGLTYYDTGVKLPLGTWSHVAVVLDGTFVRTYLNGRLAQTATNIGDVYDTSNYPITLGGADNRPDYFKGLIDEPQIFQRGLTAAQIEQLALAGSAGACVPKATSFQIVEPIAASFGSPTYPFDVRLVDETGAPVVGRSVYLESLVGAWPYSTSSTRRVTDADGRVHWDAPLKNAPRGLYEEYTAVQFDGDVDYVRQYAEPDVLVGKGIPAITWPAPAPITYSYPVNGTQLNATANVAGTFTYSVPSGTLLPAGTNTLTATFRPTDSTNYDTTTATNSLTVNKAVPTILIEAGTWSYTGSPRAAVGAVKDRFGFTIATPTLTYNGSPNPPVMPGAYTVAASYPGNSNYEPASATATLTITKATTGIVINAPDVTYDGFSHPASVTVYGLHPDYPTADVITYNGSTSSPINAGTYTVVATYNGSDIYEPATETKTFVIHKATPTVTVTGGTFTYDAVPHPASATVTGGGGTSLGAPILTYNGAPEVPVNGGTYNVVGTYPGDANHHAASGTATITINKTWPVVTVTGGTYTYDGQPHPATGSVTGVGGAQLGPLTFTYNGSSETPINAGGYSVTGTYAGDANYHAVTRYAAVQIDRAAATLTVTGGTFAYDGQPHPATVSVTGVGGVELGTPTLTYDGSANAPVNAGSYVASAVFSGDANHEYASGVALVTITKAVPTIVVNGGTFTYDGQAHPATGSVTGVGGVDLGALTFTYGGAADAPINAGSYVALGTYAGNPNYAALSRQATITIGKASATVTVTGGTFAYDMYSHPATGTVTGVNGTSLGAPSFTYNGSLNPPMNVGIYEVVGTFAGDANHNGTTGSATITIQKATPVLNWSQPAAIVYGTALGGAQLNARAVNVGGVFTYSPSAGTVLNAGTGQPLTVTFTPFDTANYVGASAATTIDVSRRTPTVTVTGGTFTYDGLAHAATGSVTGAGGAALGSPSFTYNGSSEPPVNAGSYDVVASYAGSGNYEPATASGTLTIEKAATVLNWSQPAAIVYGTALGTAQLNATSNAPGTFTYSPAAGSVLNAGTGQMLTATFTPADSTNYAAASVTTTIDVSRQTAVVTVTGGAFTYDGLPHPATGSVTGAGGTTLGSPSFTYNGSSQPPVNAGSYEVVASYAGSGNYEPASATATITIAKAAAVLSWNQPAAIVYGTPLGAAQLNATSNAPGTFTYSPAAGSVLNAGAGHPLTATFTPADSTNYSGGQVSATVSVGAAPLAIRANDATKRFGAPLPVFTASAAGFVNGDTFASLTGTLGFATTATTQSPVGSYPIAASGLGSPNYAITYVNGTLAVVRGGVTVSVATSPAPSGLDQLMTFTASVAADPPAAGAPAGTVRFFDGATLLGSRTLSSGSASLTTAGLAAGAHTIEARFDGDASFEPGTASSPHTVNTAAATPAIAISSNRNPANVGQSVTLTANISMPAGAVTGTVEFYDGVTLLGTSAIAAGSATFTTTSLAAGSHAMTVRYLGSASAPPVRSSVFVQAVGAAGWKNRSTSVALSSSQNPSASGSDVSFTANVTGSSGSMPTGRILFMVNGEVVGSATGVSVAPLSGSTAQATVVLSGAPVGRHAVTATYLGDSTYKGSAAGITQTVQ
jgi:hypothetical protein